MTKQKYHSLEKLFNSVCLRIRIDNIVKLFSVLLLVFSGVYLLLFLTSRLLGILPDYFTFSTLIFPPVLAFICCLLFAKSAKKSAAAAMIDSSMMTNDLYLTAAMIHKSHGDYKNLVVQQAENESKNINPAKVIQYNWSKKLIQGAVFLGVLALGIQYLPQLDPFGKNEIRERKQKDLEELKKTEEATKNRLLQLKKNPPSDLSKEVKTAMEDLKNNLNSMKPKAQKQNTKDLLAQQRKISKLWQQKKESLEKELKSSFQNFGMQNSKAQQWKKEIKKGDFSGIKKEMDSIKKLAKKLSQAKTAQEKQELQNKISQKMNSLSDFLAKNATSKPLQAALKRAIKQMKMASKKNTGKQAAKAAEKTMELAKRELEKLAETAKDVQNLEEALEAIQQAQKMNQQAQLDGAETSDLESIEDYKKMYERMLRNSKQGRGRGNGKGTPGSGGGKVAEKENDVDFKKLKARSKFQAGKILMKWKSKESSDPGVAKEEYLDSLRKVKQKVSESIVKEEVPPGYHKAIKKYFDSKPSK